MRVALDTNVLMSGLFWRGAPNRILEFWYEKRFDLLVSPDIFTEYTRVAEELNRKFPAVQIKSLLDLITLNACFVDPGKRPVPVCDDPDDEIFLAAAIAGKARFIVTGDKALLRVEKYPNGRVVGVKKFIFELS